MEVTNRMTPVGSMIEGIPVFRVDKPGKVFAKNRKVSMRDFYRFMEKLHGGILLDRFELAQALLEKDVQRLKKHVTMYIKSESSKYKDCAVFLKRDTTVQELASMGYVIYYQVVIELSVGEVKDEE